MLAAAEAVDRRATAGEIERITWHEAMDRFGVDKPDLRFGMELVELTDVFAATEFKAFAGAAAIKGIRVPGAADEYGRNKLDELTDRAKSLGRQGPGVAEGRRRRLARVAGRQVPVDAEQAGAVASASRAEPGDLLLIVADEWATTCEVLGQLRNDLGRPPVHEGPYRYVWVVDFPLFVGVDAGTGRPKPGHHPFTQPHPDDVAPARVRPDDGALARPTTSCSTAGSSARARSGSTSPSCSAGSSALLGISDEEADRKLRVLPQPVPRTARRRTAASPSASTAWWRSSPARRTSARSSPSRRPSPAPTR